MYIGMDTFHMALTSPITEREARGEYEFLLRSVLCFRGWEVLFESSKRILRISQVRPADCLSRSEEIDDSIRLDIRSPEFQEIRKTFIELDLMLRFVSRTVT